MELDSLKEIWRETSVKEPVAVVNEEIIAMLNKSSKSPIARMMRNVLAETILVIVLFGSVAAYYFIAFNGRFSSIAWVYIVTALLCTGFYYRKWKLLHSMQCIGCQVKVNLKRQVNTLEKYVRFYMLFGTAIVPAVFIFLALLFYSNFPEGSFGFLFPKVTAITPITWAIWIGVLLALTVLVFRSYRWYINRLYGQHIQQLKRLLEQMEE